MGNQKIWEALNASHEEEGKKRKARGEEKCKDGWITSMGFNGGDEESSEGLTDKHERKKQKILKQINGMNKRK